MGGLQTFAAGARFLGPPSESCRSLGGLVFAHYNRPDIGHKSIKTHATNGLGCMRTRPTTWISQPRRMGYRSRSSELNRPRPGQILPLERRLVDRWEGACRFNDEPKDLLTFLDLVAIALVIERVP
jgi:hypothetical protein